METKVICQEILIIHHSQFFSKELDEREGMEEIRKLSPVERLAEACWNGLINETLPEICSSLLLTEITEADEFIELRYNESSQKPEREFSINPYAFITTTHYN